MGEGVLLKRSTLLAALLLVSLAASIAIAYTSLRPSTVHVESYGTATIAYRTHAGPGLALRLQGLPAARGTTLGVTVYGWLPNGRFILLGKASTKIAPLVAVPMDAAKLRVFAKEWLSYALRRRLDPSTIEPPITILVAATVPGHGVYSATTSVPVRIDLIAKGLAPYIKATMPHTAKVMDWKEATEALRRPRGTDNAARTPASRSPAMATPLELCTPPKCIVVNESAFWYIQRARYLRHVKLPVVLARIAGPDIYADNYMMLWMLIYTDNANRMDIYVSGPAVAFKKNGVTVGKPEVPGYTFVIRHGRILTLAELTLRVHNGGNGYRGAVSGENILGKDTETLVVKLSDNDDNYVAIGIYGNITYATYQLYICDLRKYDGIQGCRPVEVYLERTYVAPELVRYGNIQAINMWYSVDADGSWVSAPERVYQNMFDNPEVKLVDLGAKDGGFDEDVALIQSRFDSNPVLTVTGGIPLTPDDVPAPVALEVALFSIGIASEHSTLYAAIAKFDLAVRTEYLNDGLCVTWPQLFETKDKLLYWDDDRGYVGYYPLATMSFDVFMWNWYCPG